VARAARAQLIAGGLLGSHGGEATSGEPGGGATHSSRTSTREEQGTVGQDLIDWE
jgi:hypothetical protein